MTEREIALIQEAKAYEKLRGIDPHRRHPARGNDIGQLKRRQRRRRGKWHLRQWAREWRG
jgi:hypothetical protein